MVRMKKGFTLIELLVVIAIIGILSSVVLASLNSARRKGSDAAVKGALDSFKAQAALYYDGAGNQSYDSATTAVCTGATTGVFTDSQVKAIISNATSNASSISCKSTATTTAVSALLMGAQTNWCVDSAGNSTSTTIQADGLCI